MLDPMTSLKLGFCAHRVLTLHCIYGRTTKGQGMLPGMAPFTFEGTVCYELQCPCIQSFQLLQQHGGLTTENKDLGFWGCLFVLICFFLDRVYLCIP